jgi:hypothetical protein
MVIGFGVEIRIGVMDVSGLMANLNVSIVLLIQSGLVHRKDLSVISETAIVDFVSILSISMMGIMQLMLKTELVSLLIVQWAMNIMRLIHI